MTDNLQSISARIRALLAKTTSAGATEAEALSAAAKARELLDKYQLDLSDLELREEGTSTVESDYDNRGIAEAMVKAIAHYCDCKVWGDTRDLKNKKIKFLGLRSDADLTSWLYATLSAFCMSEALDWSLSEGVDDGRLVREFTIGCAKRIAERLRLAKDGAQISTEGKALMIVKNKLVTEAWAALNLGNLRTVRNESVSQGEAWSAGYSKGNDANFGRPVPTRNSGLLAQGGK